MFYIKKENEMMQQNKQEQIIQQDQSSTTESQSHKESFDLEINSQRTSIENLSLVKKKKNFGNNIVCCFIKGEPQITLGPQWPLFICSSSFFIGIGYLVAQLVAINKGDFIYYSTIFDTVLQVLIYTITALKNPGIKTLKSFEKNHTSGIGYCSICFVKKDNDTYHCYDCDVCIEAYDHHCPWTGKCIGKGNQLPFNAFVTHTFFFLGYLVFVSVI